MRTEYVNMGITSLRSKMVSGVSVVLLVVLLLPLLVVPLPVALAFRHLGRFDPLVLWASLLRLLMSNISRT
jgi:hypothetical protein